MGQHLKRSAPLLPAELDAELLALRDENKMLRDLVVELSRIVARQAADCGAPLPKKIVFSK